MEPNVALGMLEQTNELRDFVAAGVNRTQVLKFSLDPGLHKRGSVAFAPSGISIIGKSMRQTQ